MRISNCLRLMLACLALVALPSIQALNSFRYTGPLAKARSHHTATLLSDGRVLVAAGDGTNSAISSAEVFDPATGIWTTTLPLATARQSHAAMLLPDGRVLVTGGLDTNYDKLASAEIYDPVTGVWTPTGAMNRARDSHTMTLLPNGKVLVTGGFLTGSGPSAEVYDPANGSWVATGPLTFTRTGHTATLLPNGGVLVAGGVAINGLSGKPVASAETYDPATGEWTATGTMLHARASHTATRLPDGRVLVASGTAGLFSAELYDPATGSWADTGSLAVWRAGHSASLLPNGRVLVAGGYSQNAVASVEIYDPATGIWNPGSPMSTPRSNLTATLLATGDLLITGGFGRIGKPARAELFDSADGSWSTPGNLLPARSGHTATLLPTGKVLVAGGASPTTRLTESQLFDPATGSFTATGSLNTARDGHKATLLPDGKVLITGGAGAGGNLSSAELYDPATGTWTSTGPLATARYGHTATLLPDGRVLVAAGVFKTDSFYPATYLNSAELYDPATGTWTATGGMSAGRLGAQAVSLADGRVLVIGIPPGVPELRGAELYDPVTGLWSDSAVSPRGNPTVTRLASGKVLVVGGDLGGNTADLFDPATGTWTATGPMAFFRREHTATLLPDGRVLVVGGRRDSGLLGAVELYEIGLGFDVVRQPQLDVVTSPLVLGGSLTLTGSGLRGGTGASGGNYQDSSSDHPVVQLRSLETGRTLFLEAASWSTDAYRSLPVTGLPPGWVMATLFVNGLPSRAGLLALVPPPSTVNLTIQWSAEGVILIWPGADLSLQAAPRIDGPFITIPDAVSPHTNLITEEDRFFRLKGN